jgi:murein DD-endopeptidase MepM/ murein hydrolase activator NlpD
MPLLRRLSAVAVVSAMFVPAPASAGDPLAAAQARVEAARRAANEAGASYEAAQNAYYTLQVEIVRNRATLDSLRAEVTALAARARARAVEAYVGQSQVGVGQIVSGGDILDTARRTEFLDRVNAIGDDAVDRLGAMSEDLTIRERALSKQLERQKTVTASLRAQQDSILQALARAKSAEAQLRARIAEERRKKAARARVARAERVLNGAATTVGASGVIIGGGSWACPAPGSSFVDTFGAPRSGGRRHQGNDMMAPFGSPIVAVVSGSIEHSTSNLGGNQIWLHGSDGNSYFYAHLSSYVGPPRSVVLGELIGRVGNTGDAAGGPTHLHFEIHPGGGAAVDPYSTLRAHC